MSNELFRILMVAGTSGLCVISLFGFHAICGYLEEIRDKNVTD